MIFSSFAELPRPLAGLVDRIWLDDAPILFPGDALGSKHFRKVRLSPGGTEKGVELTSQFEKFRGQNHHPET